MQIFHLIFTMITKQHKHTTMILADTRFNQCPHSIIDSFFYHSKF